MASLEVPDALSLGLRVISVVLLLNATGISLFIAVFGNLAHDLLPLISRVGARLAVAALIAVTAHHLLEAARMTGDMSGVADTGMQMTALRSSEGAAFVVRALGLLCVLVAFRRNAAVTALAVGGSLLTVGSFALMGHTAVASHRAAAAIGLALHVLIIAFWMGALWPLYIAADRSPRTSAVELVEAFSRQAVKLVPLILFAGVALAVLLVPDLSAFKQPYGQLLLTKAALFALLMALATLNRWRFGPALAQGISRPFKLTVIAEYILICSVLAVTAVMTTLYSPEGP